MSQWRYRGAKRARTAREEFGLDPAAPLDCLLDVVEEHAGLPVVIGNLRDGVDGACAGPPDGRILWLSARTWTPRQRFTLAHELGHVRVGGHDSALIVDTYETMYGQTTNQWEVEANAFAAELLVPKAAMEEEEPEPDLDALVTLAARFGTSAQMTLFRFTTCNRISVARTTELLESLREKEHFAAFERLELTPFDDRLSRLANGELYLSPALADSALGACLRGEAAMAPPLARALVGLLGPIRPVAKLA